MWRGLDLDRTNPWFRSIGRNRKSVAIDLRKPEGRRYVYRVIHDISVTNFPFSLAKQLAIKSDVILENFKLGSMSGDS